MVNIPSDLRKNKETIMGNMDLRECICLFIGLLLAIGILYYIRVVLGYKRIVIAAFIAGLFIIPFLFMGFKRINGMKIDDYFKVFVNNKIIANSNRLNVCQYAEMQVKNKKYELIRYYKLKLRKEILSLRDKLKNENNLILTEYIDYNNESYVIFRLDGKGLILEQIKKHKELINNKKIEIKEFIKNVIKVLKKEKIKLTKKNKKSIRVQYKHLKEIKKEKIKTAYKKVDKLKNELKSLMSKTFDELKDEVDIFENMSGIKAERIFVKITNEKKKNETADSADFVLNYRKRLNEDGRNMYQLHLFNMLNFRGFIKNINNKFVFININNEVDVYTFNDDVNKDNDGTDGIVDLIEVDKKQGIFEGTILSLEARNFYNHYRNINDLEEIL